MKRFVLSCLLLLPLLLGAQSKSTLTVVSWDASNSIGRGKDVKKGKMDVQRLWSNSFEAAADMLAELDADIIGLQDVCDSIAGRAGSC